LVIAFEFTGAVHGFGDLQCQKGLQLWFRKRDNAHAICFQGLEFYIYKIMLFYIYVRMYVSLYL